MHVNRKMAMKALGQFTVRALFKAYLDKKIIDLVDILRLCH